MMRTPCLAICLLLPAIAFSQTAPPGDIYQSGTPQPVEQAYQKLYDLAAEITADPSFDFQQAQADQSHWPDIAKAQAQWDAAMAQSGNALTQDQRNNIIPCVAHLNAAIDETERGYLISQTQQSNPLSARTVVTLYGEGKLDFAKCLSTGIVANNETASGTSGEPQGGTNGATTGAGDSGSPTGGSGSPTGNGTNPMQGSVSTSPQPVPDFNNQLLADAQTLLQNAGRISKAMTDAMDVTKHNNVGIGVAFGAAFGAAGKMMSLTAQQYRLLAAASAVAQESPILQIAGTAASDSGSLATEAEQIESQMGSAGASMGVASGSAGYMEGATDLSSATTLPAQSVLPTCTPLACARLSQLLGRNIEIMRILEEIKPRIKITSSPTGEIIAKGGLTAPEVAAGLKNLGINAQVGSGIGPMKNALEAGNPVIAGVYTMGKGNGPLHSIVIEGIENRGKVPGLNIYDPAGWNYWQPVADFAKYFTNEFIQAL